MQQLTEIRWHARAGQGAVTAAKVVAETALSADQYMQAMPEYGPERMGAPIKAFTRISPEPIEIHNNIETPNVVVVLDESLVDIVDVADGLTADGTIIVNTCSPAADVKRVHDALVVAFNDPAVKETMARQGNTISISSPEQAQATFRRELAKYAALVKKVGLEPQ